METSRSVPSDAANQTARHTLFVEGDLNSIDPTVLKKLLQDTPISIKALSAAMHIKSAAHALHPYHGSYYFLIDRDHCTDAEVERSWTDFPDPDKHNLLIWKKRQLENYFLDPDYLSKSEFLKATREQLNASLLKHAANRIYLDLANLTITQIREFQKEKWIAQFSNPAEFESAAIALKKVKECPEIRSRARIIADHLATVETIFQKFQQKLLDGAVKPVFGKGEWLNLMDGKALYCTIVNECFKVTDADGKELKGKDAQKTLALDLLQKGLTEQPKDFQDLHKMVKTLTTRAIRG